MATQFQDPYAQMAKNTVDSRAQLKESNCVKLDRPDGRGVRVMFVGNSITLHGAKPDIGWHQEWGMAASAKEKDYVHLLEDKILAIDPEASFCICQVASWERQYKEGDTTHSLFEVHEILKPTSSFCAWLKTCPRTAMTASHTSESWEHLPIT